MTTPSKDSPADIEALAEVIYNTHWRERSPIWPDASENVKNFVRKQALEAIRWFERRIRTD